MRSHQQPLLSFTFPPVLPFIALVPSLSGHVLLRTSRSLIRKESWTYSNDRVSAGKLQTGPQRLLVMQKITFPFLAPDRQQRKGGGGVNVV